MSRTNTRRIWDRYWKKQWEDQKTQGRKPIRKDLNGEILPINGYYSKRLQGER